MTTPDPGTPLLAGLSETQRSAVTATGRIEDYAAGTRLFDESGDADRCWIVISGHVAVDTHVPHRGPVTLQSVGPGELLGWSWLIPPYRWHFGAVTVTPTRALVLDAGQVRTLVEADPALGYRFTRILLETLVNRLQATRLRLLDLYRNPA
ncbi:Crp/Fnr family transcriptional regulator [Amycolatopsis sp. TNS106]|uniref:Crp/Fnr family transcriptional regulator n=1 Tax=Amycolatopsis sp. TNS106 TaxID=2861750 RepID=UPI001C59676A|nr:cyclic nucleotide-binding domain-containing protein [Amycolatopsis sp. TNS106]QXV56528.1 crotonobetainyl-CoA--carnitine CoA-transferase [Amycolatopsis sp. TNS106]